MMVVIRIEHAVPDFNAWKQAFNSDPLGRQQSGVRCYRALRPLDNPNFAAVELEFDTLIEAEAMHLRLQEVWGHVAGTVIGAPHAKLFDLVERVDY
jgi:hypothetical protein